MLFAFMGKTAWGIIRLAVASWSDAELAFLLAELELAAIYLRRCLQRSQSPPKPPPLAGN